EREQVKSALIYPLVVMTTCIASIAVLVIFVIPKFKPLFEQAGTQLPLAARAVLGASDFANDYWWSLILVPVLFILLVVSLLRREAWRKRRDGLVLRLPLFGDLVRKLEVARLTRNLGTLLKNEVPLTTAILITR